MDGRLPWPVKKRRRNGVRDWINSRNEMISEATYSLSDKDFTVSLALSKTVGEDGITADQVSAILGFMFDEIVGSSVHLADLMTGEVFPSQRNKIPQDRPGFVVQMRHR